MNEKESSDMKPTNANLFKGLQYHIIGSLSDKTRTILDASGAKKHAYLSEAVSYAISDNTDNEAEYSEAVDIYDIPVVSGEWVIASQKCGVELPVKAFLPLQIPRLFSGRRFCFTHLSPDDQDSIWAMVTYYGGLVQDRLDNVTTHLITTKQEGVKYSQALTLSNVKIVTPDWVYECVKVKKLIDENYFHPKRIISSPALRKQLLSPLPKQGASIGESKQAPESSDSRQLRNPITPRRARQPTPRHRSLSPMAVRQSHHSNFPSVGSNFPQASNMQAVGQMLPAGHSGNMQQMQPHVRGSSQQPMSGPMSPYMSTATATKLEYQKPPPMSSTPTTRPLHRPIGSPHMVSHQLQNTTPNPLHATAQPQQQHSPMLHMGLMTEVPYPSQASMPEETPIIKMTNMAAFPMGSGGGSQQRKSPAKSTLKNVTNSNVSTATETPVKSPGKAAKASHATEIAKSPSKSNQVVQPSSIADNVYFGYDVTENVPGDMCLIGCIFYMGDYLKAVGAKVCEDWTKTIEQHGGTVDPSYSNRVTHVLVETQHSDVFTLALNDHKRAVTAYWLNDVLGLKKMEPPWQAYHLPHPHGEKKLCSNQIICISGFKDIERAKLKVMIGCIGASFTSYLARSNSVLICKKLEGEKVVKAREWQIPIVNVEWLSDLLLGNTQALKLPVADKYKVFGKQDNFLIDASMASAVMAGWRVPLKIPKDCWRKFKPSSKSNESTHDGKRKAEEEMQGIHSKRIRMQDVQNTRSGLPSGRVPHVLLTGFKEMDKNIYSRLIHKLGGKVCTDPRECTHVIAEKIVRTPKFLIAMNYCMFITSPEWINESSKHGRFLDERLFSLQDSEAGSMWNLLEALETRRMQGPPFNELIFHITPSVAASAKVSVAELHQFIEAGGGSILKSKKRWSCKEVLSCQTSNNQPRYIVITCRDDALLCLDLLRNNVDVYTVEFILSGLMLQKPAYEHNLPIADVPLLQEV